MIRAFSKLALALALLAALALPMRASATLEADPQVLYGQMKDAFNKAAAHGWAFMDHVFYLSTIFNAGRAYSLQRPDDPHYAEVAQFTVDIASGTHWNPLTNHDAAGWYVREASLLVQKNGDPAEVAKATELLKRVDAEDDAVTEAQLADEDAAAAIHDFGHDPDAYIMRVEANWRAYVLTRDASWRTLAFQRAAPANFPVGRLPTTWGNDFINAAQAAAAEVQGYTAGDAVNAKQLLAHLKAVQPLRLIASVRSVPHDVYMTTLAPADEYFGSMGMSILGMKNEFNRITQYLDSGWGDRESGAAVQLAQSVDDMHKVYPRDRDLPALLLQTYNLLQRIQTGEAHISALHLRSILTIEYQDSQQARSLLSS
ncbi:MAG: hypothetical protein DLM50_02320 [Candidatus Meridianibacter frigidus]|nr:MAG: hypothetical protein DLM50_02320 [Candidatus Eremiobacteraeota bacterium]